VLCSRVTRHPRGEAAGCSLPGPPKPWVESGKASASTKKRRPSSARSRPFPPLARPGGRSALVALAGVVEPLALHFALAHREGPTGAALVRNTLLAVERLLTHDATVDPLGGFDGGAG
jgi:hypothetical protein